MEILKHIKMKKITLLFLAMIVSGICLKAQSFNATYPFTGVNTTSGTTDPTPVPTATGLTFGSFSAVGASTNSNATGRFSFTGWPTGSTNGNTLYSQMTGSMDTARYFEVTLTPDAGYSMSLDTITFDVRRSGTGIRSYVVRSSIDGYTTNIANTISPTNANLSLQGTNEIFINTDFTNNLSGSMALLTGGSFGSLTSPVTFRFYAWNAEAASGTFSLDNVHIYGYATSLLPAIVSDPQNLSICQGSSAIFNAVASNAVSYQWEEDNGTGFVAISNSSVYSGVDTDSLIILNTTGMTGYVYHCVVTNGYGNATTLSATLTVNAPVTPSVTIPPSLTLCAGNDVLGVATGVNDGASPTYTWNVINLGPVGNGPSLYIPAGTIIPGTYSVYCELTVSETCVTVQTVDSDTMTVIVNPAPAIPVITAVANVLSTSSNDTYQWYFGASPLGTNQSETVTSTGIYSVQVGNSFGCTAMSANYSFDGSPIINTQPIDASVCSGAQAVFTLNATDAITYQWEEDNGTGFVAISNSSFYSGVDTETLNVLNSTGMSGYVYHCVITNSFGTTVSNSVVLTESAPVTPSVSIPTSLTICENMDVTGTATGLNDGATPTYVWYVVGMGPGGTGQTLFVPAGTIPVGSYQVYCELTSSLGCTTIQTVDSDTMLLVVNPAPTIPIVSALANVLSTSTYDTYQWYLGAAAMGTTQSETATQTGTYSVDVSNSFGCTAVSADFYFDGSPAITSQPIDASVCDGSTAMFIVGATDAVSYQWEEDNGSGYVAISNSSVYTGVDTDTLRILNTTGLTGYTYHCVISNSFGTTTSNAAILTSSAPVTPSVTIPASMTICANVDVTGYATGVNDGTTPTYVWNLVNMGPVGTGQTLFVPAGTIPPGTYQVYCELTSSLGCTTAQTVDSDTLLLVVNPAPTPIVSAVANVLSTGTFASYQWYYGTTALGTNQSETVSQSGIYTVMVTNASGCSAVSADYNFVYVGIENMIAEQNVSIYPNPSTDGTFILDLGIATNTSISVYNVIGKLVMNKEVAIGGKQIINLSSEANGCYFVSIKNDKSSTTQKVTITK